MTFTDRFDLAVPIIQAPMAGVATPALAASVSEAGAMGSIGIGASDVATARSLTAEVRARTARPFNVNVFVHAAPRVDEARDRAWLDAFAPLFAEFDAQPPAGLRAIYTSFADDREMVAMLIEAAPPVVSFHFGLPPADVIAALHSRGIYLMATATSPDEGSAIEAAGIDGLIAQGIEAGGHRGVFDPTARDDALGMAALTRMLARRTALPVIAAGGIMDGAGVAAALALGAAAAQLGTAFVACPESAADDAYREALCGPAAYHTVLTSLISGRPARTLANRFTALTEDFAGRLPPEYPIAYDAGKALNAAAKARGEHGFGAHWAGQGAPMCRTLPAADLVRLIARELASARRSAATTPRPAAD